MFPLVSAMEADLEFGPLTLPETLPSDGKPQTHSRLRDPAVMRRHLVASLDDLELIYGPLPPGAGFHVVETESIFRQCVRYADVRSLVIDLPSKLWFQEHVFNAQSGAVRGYETNLRQEGSWTVCRPIRRWF